MDTHSVVCWAHRTVPHRGTTRRYRCREHHRPDLIITGTSRRPPYRERGVGIRGEKAERDCRPIRCCIVVSEMQASHDHTTTTTTAAAVTMPGGVALLTGGCYELRMQESYIGIICELFTPSIRCTSITNAGSQFFSPVINGKLLKYSTQILFFDHGKN